MGRFSFEGPSNPAEEGFRQGSETADGRAVIKSQYQNLEARVLQAMEQKRVDGINGEKAARRDLASALRQDHPGKFETLADRIEKGIGSIQW